MVIEESTLREVLSNWNIGEIEEIKKLERGVSNHNWFVKASKGRFVLRKIKKDKKLSKLNFEFLYLAYLKQNGFGYKTPSLISTKEEENVVKNKGYFWLYKFIEGDFVENFTDNGFKEEAKMMAKYHSLLKKIKIKNNGIMLDDMAIQLILEELEKFKEGINQGKIKTKINDFFLKETDKLPLILKEIKTKEYARLRKYPIHRDMNPENLLWKNKKLVGVIDWENVGGLNDAFIKDISIVLQHCCLKDNLLDIEKSKLFIDEYKKHKELSDKEISLLPDILVGALIEDFSYEFWLEINDSERANFSKMKFYSKCAQKIFVNRKELSKRLLK